MMMSIHLKMMLVNDNCSKPDASAWIHSTEAFDFTSHLYAPLGREGKCAANIEFCAQALQGRTWGWRSHAHVASTCKLPFFVSEPPL